MEQTVALWPDTTANAATPSPLPLSGSASLTGNGAQAQPTAHKVDHSLQNDPQPHSSHTAATQDLTHLILDTAPLHCS